MKILGHEKDVMVVLEEVGVLAIAEEKETRECEIVTRCYDDMIILGRYANKERAKEVLADIVWCIDTVYQMPLE